MIFEILSTKNEKYKFFKALKTKKARTEYKLYTVEGIKSVKDAVTSGAQLYSIVVSKEFYDTVDFEYPKDVDIYVIGNNIYNDICSTDTPQGILAIIKQKETELLLNEDKAYIYCDRLQDPGNLGTIIRTADAAGFGGVLMSMDTVDLYNPKVVRASMGSFFHIDKFQNIKTEQLLELKSKGFLIVSAILSDKTVEYTKVDYNKPVIIVIGNEANGISDEVINLSDVFIKIPIDGDAESLNAAIAAAVIMYEVRRQRKN